MVRTLTLFCCQLIPALILLPAVKHKFAGDPGSVDLFTTIGMEPNGRILIGVLELICVILLVIPGSSIFGAILGLGIMIGAIIGHITIIGFSGGLLPLFISACIVGACCSTVIYLRRDQVPAIQAMFDQ